MFFSFWFAFKTTKTISLPPKKRQSANPQLQKTHGILSAPFGFWVVVGVQLLPPPNQKKTNNNNKGRTTSPPQKKNSPRRRLTAPPPPGAWLASSCSLRLPSCSSSSASSFRSGAKILAGKVTWLWLSKPYIWLWLNKPVPEWNPGRWKKRTNTCVTSSCLILSHTHIIFDHMCH